MLTKLLKERLDVADELASLVPPIGSGDGYGIRPLLAYPRTENYALVGTAFDYLMRWEIARRNPLAKARPWVATIAVKKIVPLLAESKLDAEIFPKDAPFRLMEPGLVKLYRQIEREARAFYSTYLGTTTMTREIVERAAKLCIGLSKIDPLYRAGKVDERVKYFAQEDVEDVIAVYDAAPWDDLSGDAKTIPLLNPEFGSYSRRLGGSDADLVVGSTLLDLKTTKYADISKHFAQIVGYGILGDLYHETEDPTFPVIDRAGIYFSRHGWIQTFDYGVVRSNPNYENAKTLLLNAADEMRESAQADLTDRVVGKILARNSIAFADVDGTDRDPFEEQ